jgi:prevent-host-death family protein
MAIEIAILSGTTYITGQKIAATAMTEVTMHKQYSIAEAKNRLPAIVHSVEEGGAIELTRRGKSVAVIISKHDYELLSQSGEGFLATLNTFRQGLEQEDFTISDSDFAGLRDRSPGREEDLCR